MTTPSGAPSRVACYRHPDREAPLGCSRCGRPICLDDAVDAPVGYLCPECAQQPSRVQRAHQQVARGQDATVTKVLLAVIVGMFVLQLSVPQLWLRGALVGRIGAVIGGQPQLIGVAEGEWWRIVTSGFLHAEGNILHVAFNGYLLYMLGRMLEPGVGSSRFAALFAAGLFGGSAGALAMSWAVPTIGASGAVFGLMGAAMVGLRRRGINPWQTGIGMLVIINVVFTFLAPSVSIGGHLGGFLGGALAGVPVFHLGRRRDNGDLAAGWGVVAGLAGLALLAGVTGPWVSL